MAPTYVKGRILVMAKSGLSDAAISTALTERTGGRGRRIGSTGLHIVDLPAGASEQAMVDSLSRHPHFKFAELDRIVPAQLVTNDPYLGSEWHLANIGVGQAWDSASGGGVIVAILDTGVDATHPDLAAQLVAGWNVYDNNANTSDVYGHGTKVAGTVAAAANNGIGVAGVAAAARIMPIRISDLTGSASYSAMAQGLTWAADRGARVANISYVAAGSAAVISAANYMKSKGGLVVTSAGNYGTDAGIAPTTAMIPVSATDSNNALTSWSSFGSFVALAAPGAGIYTTTSGGGYAAVSGTSFSSPVTAGVIALMMSARPTMSNANVESLLYASALDLGTAGRDVYYGYGRVDAAAAVAATMAATLITADTASPVVSVDTPLGASSVSGLVTVGVTATDNVGVSRVELRVNGALLATDTSAPYTFSFDSAVLRNGTVSLVATAYDAAGNAGISPTVSLSVVNTLLADTTPPTVSITNPANGSSVSGQQTVQVSAADNAGAAGIQQTLYVDGVKVATATGGSLSFKWNTQRLSSGSHTLQAVARDAAGNSSSQIITVNR